MTLRASVLVVVVSAAALLTACTGAPTASTMAPSPSSTSVRATPTEVTSPTPVAAAPAAVVIGPEGFEVQDAAGVALLSVSYGDDLDDVAASLAAVLGAAPVVGQDAGHIERRPFETLTWDGLRLGAYGDQIPKFDVLATGPATGGIEVRTPEGVAIGDDAATLAATYPDTFESYSPDFDIARGPAAVVDASADPVRTFSVAIYVDDAAPAITRIGAPVDSRGP
ncbi:hypothetical protein WJX64_11520 [Leifsonia sp. YIM 134122]|uniref:Uncharacterized protein n=1 Tax=Leifsonia stereocauli TaxID=3134136 RepID=A0ABU9W5A5_9MICO